MADNKMQMPGVFGGLMRYDEEYKSRIMITPTQVIGFVIAIMIVVLLLKLLFPITFVPETVGSTPIPVPPAHGGAMAILSLLF